MLSLLTPLASGVLDLQREGNIAPFLVVFVVGFAIGAAGHLTKSADLVIAGILIAGIAAAMPIVLWS
ncbi:unannotated protein [freshwater metagenome]|uniref:Unannotated protein n=1 Tax=freshwater metagenome TaxID=449393 RepID=A0A6J7CRX9_9ZZZZ|nr:hypothetical protein [Actinomycetota bacterium]